MRAELNCAKKFLASSTNWKSGSPKTKREKPPAGSRRPASVVGRGLSGSPSSRRGAASMAAHGKDLDARVDREKPGADVLRNRAVDAGEAFLERHEMRKQDKSKPEVDLKIDAGTKMREKRAVGIVAKSVLEVVEIEVRERRGCEIERAVTAVNNGRPEIPNDATRGRMDLVLCDHEGLAGPAA